ncbi:RNA polymerase sigma factor [Nocardia sp. NPDC059180]|uniref:RNA polymerase sigma factor n=1 Tax=Nocardia sp. NPDC059180 TaxID=3346761 RepID=UPI0036C96BBA
MVLDRAQIDRDLREDIALETFCTVLQPFLRALDAGGYDSTRGTTITTYFLGACRNRLGDVIRAHQPRLAMERQQETSALLEHLRDDIRFHSNLDYDRFDDVDLAQRMLIKAPHDLRAALLLHIEEGITLKDAAIRTGSKPATIRSKLLRHRKKLARMHFAGVVVLPENTSLGDWARAIDGSSE